MLLKGFRMLKNLKSLQRADVRNIFENIDVVLTDCDGVIWLENEATKNAAETLNTLRDMGKKVFFVTNNSLKTREEFAAKARNMGFKCDKEEIMSTSYLAANYLKSINFNKKVYIVGSDGIAKELSMVGIESFGDGPDVLDVSIGEYVSKFHMDPDVGAVVVGFDQHISYVKMLKAASYLNKPDSIFLATNTDERFPVPNGQVIPGTGPIVSAIKTVSAREPMLLGKPGDFIYQALKNLCDIKPERTLMIGDRCNTDILLGTKCGFKTLLVLTGVSTLEEVEAWKISDKKDERDLVPDYYIDAIGDLLEFLNC